MGFRKHLCAGPLVICAATAAASPRAGRADVRVPVAPPWITIVADGEPEPEWHEPPVRPENEIVLRGFDAGQPTDVRDAVEVLRAALPPDYLALLMRDFGYRPNARMRRPQSRRTDLREVDLARFLFEHWVFADPETRLAREFLCMSAGEQDISVFLTLLVAANRGYPEQPIGWDLPRGARMQRLAWTADSNARAAWASCSRSHDDAESVSR
jgi:hypothetical protein